MRKTKHKNSRHIAIEIGLYELQLAVLEVSETGSKIEIDRQKWRDDSAVPHHDPHEEAELAEALSQLASKWNLKSEQVHLCLSSDFCVTRSVTGKQDHVQSELEELEERKAIYLSLGTGQKNSVVAVRDIDAVHQHGLVAVVRSQTLDVICNASRRAKLSIQAVEPSAVGLCRLIGLLEEDSDEPVLVLNLSENWVDVCLTYQGHLYLAYRPAIGSKSNRIVPTILRHLVRLKRYCFRYSLLTSGQLNRVYVTGRSEAVAHVVQELSKTDSLQVVSASSGIEKILQCSIPEELQDESAAVVGTAITNHPNLDVATLSPNLHNELYEHEKNSWSKLAKKYSVHIAVAATIAFLLQTMLWHKRAKLEELRVANSTQIEAQDVLFRLDTKLSTKKREIKQLEQLTESLASPSSAQVLTWFSQCLPPTMVLDSFVVESTGQVVLLGRTASEKDIYEFITTLKRLPIVGHARLRSTSTNNEQANESIGFDIACDFFAEEGVEDETI